MRKVLVAFGTVIGIVVASLLGSSLLYAYVFPSQEPRQPIAFNHKLHAGDNGIPCLFCHVYATKSRVAGVPSVQKCVECHSSIKRDSPEVQKILSYMDSGKPIPWVKVYNAADYIYFPHNRHLKGGVACEECHGNVKSMTRIVRYATPGMGWCLICHQKRNGPTDCWACHI